MNPTTVYRPVHKHDDLAEYVERYSPDERDELRVASLAHDIVFLREHARRENGARVVVTIAVPWYDLGVERLARYLTALGERVDVTEQQLETGRYLQIAPVRRQTTGTHLSAASD
jgi:hypothetical protein